MPMWYPIIIASVVAFIGLIAAFFFGRHISKSTKKGETYKYRVVVNFGFTLIAVLIGAFLAFQISVFIQESSEYDEITARLSVATIELDDEIALMKVYYEDYSEKNPVEATGYLNANDLQKTISLNILVENKLFPKYFSEDGIMLILRYIKDTDRIRDFINNENYNIDRRINGINFYINHLVDLKGILVLEAEMRSGNITYEEYVIKLNDLN